MTDQAMSPLRRRMIEDMTIRKLTPKTQQGYIRTIRDFAAFLGRSNARAIHLRQAGQQAQAPLDPYPRAATSLHPKTLRKNLLRAGVIDGSQADLSDHNVLFDAARGEKIAKELSRTVTLAKAGEHLGAPRSQVAVLVKSGLINPTLPVSATGAQARYAVADLDAFLEALRRNAVTAGRAARNLASIPDAARQACRSAAEVVQRILDGDIPTAVRRQSDAGYLAILVDPRKVASAVRGQMTVSRSGGSHRSWKRATAW
jgi:hypothetical protein